MQEKVSFKNSKKLNLVGMLWKAPSPFIVILAHGSASNRLAKGLFTQIAQALQQEHYNVLAFDFSGHGESDDAIMSLHDSVDDVASAITFAQAQGYKKIALLGHSLGAFACLSNYSSAIETMMFLGPLTGPVQWRLEDMCTAEQLAEVKQTGSISVRVNDGLREWLKVDGNLLNDIQAIDQEKLFKQVGCPLLIIHGGADQQERDLRDTTQKGLDYLPEKSVLKIIPEAEHSFLNVTNQVIAALKQWLQLFK